MWTMYHGLRTSVAYHSEWPTFLQSSISISKVPPIFCQYVGNFVFKALIKPHHPIAESTESDSFQCLTYEETNALRYAAGNIPRALKKKLLKSTHPLKENIQLCILDLLDDGDEDQSDSQDWLQLIDRGLTRVNNTTFEMFVAMEYELCRHIHQGQLPKLEHIITSVAGNKDVLFLWSLICTDCEESSASALLQMVIHQWVKVRRFSYASAWLEKYKLAQKQITQKYKGVHKHLISKPQAKSKSTTTNDKFDLD